MNSKKFSEALSELDSKYVDEAINYKKKSKKIGLSKKMLWIFLVLLYDQIFAVI